MPIAVCEGAEKPYLPTYLRNKSIVILQRQLTVV